MSTRRKQEEPTRGFKLFSFAYFIIIVVVAFFISGQVMNQWDIYELLGLNTITIPVIEKSAGDIPELAIQLVLTGILFFVLQFITVFIIGIFKKEEDEYEQAYRDQYRR